MHSQNKEGIFVSACSDLRTLFSVSRHQSSNARRSTSRFKASVSAFQQHTVFLMSSMSSSMASGLPGRSVWRTHTEIGVMFSAASQSADFMGQERDIAPLIELLEMAAKKWPSSESDDVSETELFCRDQTLLEMWPEACRRTGVGVREFPPGVIELWKQRMGRAN